MSAPAASATRRDGRLTRWNEERGFGFIEPNDGGPDVFVHVSAFPRDGQRPQPGELVHFDLVLDETGRARAVNVSCPFRPRAAASRPRTVRRPAAMPRRGIPLLVPLTLAMMFGAGYLFTRGQPAVHSPSATVDMDETDAALREEFAQPSFSCDGRTHCSQMNSCEEATWVLEHCPGTEMDGNGDGVPCERQWCGD